MPYRRLELGTVEFVFEADIKFKTHRRSAARFVDKVSRMFEASNRPGFVLGSTFVPTVAIFLDPQGMEVGSLKSVAALVTIIGGLGSLTANYSEIKEEIPVLFEDIKGIAASIAEKAVQNGPPSRVLYPKEVAIRPKSTRELLRELDADFTEVIRRASRGPQAQIRGSD